MREECALVLEAVDLCKCFGVVHALQDISFSVRQGEIFGILGPSGVGKTVLFNLLSGKSIPTSGTVKMLGKDFWRHERKLRRLMGVVSAPGHDLNTLGLEFTAREHLNFEAGLVSVPHQKYQARIDATLERVGLAAYDNLPVGAFSGEMRRRLALAWALLSDPLLVLIDEPTAGVVEEKRQMIWRLLRSLQDEGKTLVLTTSAWVEVQEVCDRVTTLGEGTLQYLITP